MFVVEKCFLENVEKRHSLTMDEQMMDHQVDDTNGIRAVLSSSSSL